MALWTIAGVALLYIIANLLTDDDTPEDDDDDDPCDA